MRVVLFVYIHEGTVDGKDFWSDACWGKAIDIPFVCVDMVIHLKIGNSTMTVEVTETHFFHESGITVLFSNLPESKGCNTTDTNMYADAFQGDAAWEQVGEYYEKDTPGVNSGTYDEGFLRRLLK